MPRSRSAPRLTEARALAVLKQLLGGDRVSPDVLASIGDDAAVLAGGRQQLVWTVDVCVEGVHFRPSWLTRADVGWKSFHAAASDLAAMAAKPVAALSSLILPRGASEKDLRGIARGQRDAARALGCPIVGGNVSRGRELSVTTTVLGHAATPLLRSGARVGDEVWLLGQVGLAAAGLAVLSRRSPPRGGRAAVAECVAAWRRPRALVREASRLRGRATSAIDVSDGLAGDVLHLAEACRVRAVLDETLLLGRVRPALRRVSEALGKSPLELMLSGGEDYAVVATGPRSRRPRGVSVIGHVERGRGGVLARTDGSRRALARGFDHLA